MSEEDIAKMNKEQDEYSKRGFGRWSWFALIEKLAKGDITRFDEVTEQNFIACLNLLSYWKEKDDLQREMEKINKNKR